MKTKSVGFELYVSKDRHHLPLSVSFPEALHSRQVQDSLKAGKTECMLFEKFRVYFLMSIWHHPVDFGRISTKTDIFRSFSYMKSLVWNHLREITSFTRLIIIKFWVQELAMERWIFNKMTCRFSSYSAFIQNLHFHFLYGAYYFIASRLISFDC